MRGRGPLFHSDSAKSIGLGLNISRQIVSKCGGQLDFVSIENKGSTFIATFKVEEIRDKPNLFLNL